VNQGNERKLRASDELFAKAFNANPHSMSLATLEEGRILEVNDLQARYESLTAREREVFALVTSGCLNKQIAQQLGTSERTIKAHRAQVVLKMRADSVADLVRMADRLGVVAPRR